MQKQEIDKAVFAKRFASLLESSTETIYTIAEMLSLSPPTISRYSNGLMVPKITTLYAIAQIFNVNPLWLMGYDVPRYDVSDKDALLSLPGVQPPPRWVKKPLLGSIACGEPILVEENVEDYLFVPENAQCDFLLRCKGDSMINARIMDGDIVMIHQQPDVENGEIAAVRIDGEVTLKRVYKYPGMVRLVPENPKYDSMVFHNGNCNEFSIIGKAISFISTVI